MVDSALFQAAKQCDYDRSVCALFAPRDTRNALFFSIAIFHELVSVSLDSSDEMIGLIKLKWWQEQAHQAIKQHYHVPTNQQPLLVHMPTVLTRHPDLLELIDTTSQQLSEQLGKKTDKAHVIDNMRQLYCFFACILSEPEQELADIGAIYGELAFLRMQLKNATQPSEFEKALDAIATVSPSGQQSKNAVKFVQKLYKLNAIWIDTLTKSCKAQTPPPAILPLLPLKLLW